VIFTILLLHIVPPICWGARGVTVLASVLGPFAGAGGWLFVKWRNKNFDGVSEYFLMTSWRPAIIADAALRELLFSVSLNLVCYFAGLIVAQSSGVSRAVESLLVAYCMTGLYHALCNPGRPITHGFTNVESALGWLPVLMISLRESERQMFSHTIVCFAFFATSACVLFSI
jgi:hypothetical protein